MCVIVENFYSIATEADRWKVSSYLPSPVAITMTAAAHHMVFGDATAASRSGHAGAGGCGVADQLHEGAVDAKRLRLMYDEAASSFVAS